MTIIYTALVTQNVSIGYPIDPEWNTIVSHAMVNNFSQDDAIYKTRNAYVEFF